MIQVADMSGAGSPVVCRIASSSLGVAVSAAQSDRTIPGNFSPGFKAAVLRDGGIMAFRHLPVFTAEKDTVGVAGTPVPIGCAFTKLEDSQ